MSIRWIFLLLSVGSSCVVQGATLKNSGFESGSLDGWKAQTDQLEIYASHRETYTRNHAARLHGSYSTDVLITNSITQSIRAMPGDQIKAEGFIYWREYAQQSESSEAHLKAVLRGGFGMETVAWTFPHESWTYFALTGSIFGLSQGGFEGGTLAGWIQHEDECAIEAVTNTVCTGNYSCRFYGVWDDWSYNYIKQVTIVTSAVTLEARTKVYVKDLQTSGDWVSVGFELKRSGGGPIQEVTLDPDCPKDKWLPVSITLPATASGEYTLRCFVAGGHDGTSTVADVYFDDIHLWKHESSIANYSSVVGIHDGANSEFLQSDSQTSSINLDDVQASQFPHCLNDSNNRSQYFYMNLDETDAEIALGLNLITCASDESGSLAVTLDVWNGTEWHAVSVASLGSNSNEELIIPPEYLEVGKNSFRLVCETASGGVHEILWDQISVESLVSKDLTLGVLDGSDMEFKQSAYLAASIDLDVEGVSAFPKELNLYSWNKQHFHFALNAQGAEQSLVFTLSPYWSSGDGVLTVALEYWNGTGWEEVDRAAISESVDGELFAQPDALHEGINSFRLRALEGSGDTDVVTWDQIVIRTAGRNTSVHDIQFRMDYVATSGGTKYVSDTEVFLDCCRILGSTADLQPPEQQFVLLKEQAGEIAQAVTEIEPLDYPAKKAYGYVGGSDPLNYPSYAEIQMPGWSFGALKSLTNNVTTTAALIIYELPYEGPGYVEFDQFGYCDRYWSSERYTPVDVRTNAPYFTLGTCDNSSAEFGDGPFPEEHNYYVGTSLENFPKRLSTATGDGWPNRLNIIYPENYSEFGSKRDKYYTLTSVTSNGADCGVKTLKMNTYVTGDGVPEVNVESREYHMGWAQRDEAYGMVDYPNITYQERYAAGLRSSEKRMLDEDGWYMQQLVRGSSTVDPMDLYTYEDGNWIEEIYHECDFMWANAGSGVRSIYDEDHIKRLDGQVSYHVGFRVGHYYEPEPGEGGYNTHLISVHGSGYLRMTDYEGYMAGSFRPFAHDPFGLYKYDEDFPVIPSSYSRLAKESNTEGERFSYADILLPFQSDKDNRMVGVANMKLHMEPDEVRARGAYFDMYVDLWAKQDVLVTEHSPLNLFAQSDMFWRGSTNINDKTEAHDVDAVMLHKASGEWVTYELYNSPENVQVHTLGSFGTGDVLYLMQQDRGSESYGFDPGGAYRKVSGFEITMLENEDLPTSIDVYVDHTVSEYSDNVVVACPINRDISAGEQLSYAYRYRAVFAPGVHIQNPNSSDGENNWSNNTYHIDFQATDGNHSLLADIYYGNGCDNDWTLINTEGSIPVPASQVVSYAWNVEGVAAGAYYVKVTARRASGGKTGFDVSNSRLQVGPAHSFLFGESAIVTTNSFKHLGNNMGFEHGDVLGWAAIGDHLNIYADGTAGCEGLYAGRIHGAWSGWSWNNLQQDIPCHAGEVLHVSGRLYIGELQASLTDWVACGIKMESCALPGRTMTGVEFNVTSATGVWLNVDFERVAPVDGFDRLVLWVGGLDCPGANVYFDRIEVTSSTGTEVITNRPFSYWQSDEAISVEGHTALRFFAASANRGENMQVRARDALGQVSEVDLRDRIELSALPKQVVVPWTEFEGIDLSQIASVELDFAYDDMGVWQLRSVSDPLRVSTDMLSAPAVDVLGLPHYNPGQTITNIITIQNLTANSITANVQVVQEYGEDRYWLDTAFVPWMDSLSIRQGERLAGLVEQRWSNQLIGASGSVILTNTYSLPLGKRIDSQRHWIDEGQDWHIGRNRCSRGRIHVVVCDDREKVLYADSKAGWYSMDDDYDYDDDGLPDAYEASVNGSWTALDGMADEDSDGFSNEEEFIAGTHPENASSIPQTEALPGIIPKIRIETYAGREYWLEWTDDLMNPDWHRVRGSTVEGDDAPKELMDPNYDDEQKRYYRTGIRWHHSAWPL